jgi:NADPH-dependent 7-cyano-7-deazaguanine reductase QueF
MALEQLKFFPAPKFLDHIKFETEDMVTKNPNNGLIVNYTVVIEYSPDLICVEGESLNNYLLNFGEEGIHAEEIAPLLVNDLFDALDCNWVEVKVIEKTKLIKTSIASKSRSIDMDGAFSASKRD